MEQKLKFRLNQLHQFDTERRGWLALSGFVVTAVLGVIFGWNLVVQNHLIWLVVAAGLTVSVIWWYWTMKLVRHLLHSKEDEYVILSEIVKEIRQVKEDVKTLADPVDNNK
jgi:uncharacterized protein (DUF2062 family)